MKTIAEKLESFTVDGTRFGFGSSSDISFEGVLLVFFHSYTGKYFSKTLFFLFICNRPDFSENVHLNLVILPSSVDHPDLLGGISTCEDDSKTIEVGSVTVQLSIPVDTQPGYYNGKSVCRQVARLNASVKDEYYKNENTGEIISMVLNEEQAVHALDYVGTYTQVDLESILQSSSMLRSEGAHSIDTNLPIFRRQPASLSEMTTISYTFDSAVQRYVDVNSYTYVYFHTFYGW